MAKTPKEMRFRITHQKALKGDSDAQFLLCLMYLFGEDVPRDQKEYMRWWMTANLNRNPRALKFREEIERNLMSP